ncbi:MAG TPA: ribbon-helix-helix protein, CopG family [Polyangia bacterium]|jgi:predicted transcriptional regulator|nr:ribbon-helix-helix protein, CopG family [Polyangia bacterium]
MRAISLKVPQQLDDKITALARRSRSNRSAVMREALEAFTASRSAKLSVTAAAGDLVGSLKGPEDLSTSASRMADYGK